MQGRERGEEKRMEKKGEGRDDLKNEECTKKQQRRTKESCYKRKRKRRESRLRREEEKG